jgi:BASS family bile acid:Na+ symporter
VIIPVGTIVSTIVILVIIPLTIGMLVRAKWENFAKKAIPAFSILGIIALLFLIVAGILSNLDKFADTERYGVLFYTMIFIFTSLGMLSGVLIPKLFRVNNFQIRAISLETGLRNSSLAMAIALLIQDAMGDFYSSLFWVSAMFGLAMYLAGAIALRLYKIVLPVKEVTKE